MAGTEKDSGEELHFPEFSAFHLRKNSLGAVIHPDPGLAVNPPWQK
jgi:hypothetical protein